jgi:hypothetical protein
MLASTGSAAMVEREAHWFAAAAMGEHEASSITRDGQAQGELSDVCCAVHAELGPDAAIIFLVQETNALSFCENRDFD